MMRPLHYFAKPASAMALLLLLSLSSCRKGGPEAAAGGPPGPAGIAEVKVLIVKPESAVMTIEQPGRLEAYRQAEVRARVAGVVTERPYQEGQEVKAGTPLFRIDPAPLQAALDAAEAALELAEANHALALDKEERYQGLISSKAISERGLREASSEVRQAAAQIAAAKAEKEMARLKLEYATVVSPIEGRARRANVTEGALVGEGSATLLTTVEQIDPIYVNFSRPVAEVIALRDSISKGEMQGLDESSVKAEIVLANGTIYPLPGKLLFADLAVDPGTDTVAMRAIFPNPKRDLLPGMYVRVQLDQAVQNHAILLPRFALTRTGDGAQVMTVNEQEEVVPLAVEAHTMRGDHWWVTAGLKGGEKVIVENAAMMIPGTKVKAVMAE